MTFKRIALGVLYCMCALILVLGIYAQQPTTTYPAHPLPEDFSFSAITHPSPTFGRHQSVTGAHYGPLVAFNDNNEAAFLGDFFDPRTGPVRGIFTSSGREIAEDGAKIGDITILQIRATEPYDLQFNARNEVAWLALISARECGQAATCSGLFLNEKLTAVTFATPPVGYALGDNGKVTAPADHSWLTPAAAGIAVPGKGAIATPGKDTVDSVVGSIAGRIWGQIRNTTRIPGGQINVPWSPVPITVGLPSGNPLPVPGAPAVSGMPGQNGQPAPQTKAPFEVMAQLPYCVTPAGGGGPDEWSRNANAAGPIASQRQEYARGGFVSAFHPQVRGWIKKTYYSADCRQILIAAAEYPGVTQELVSPAGMIASFDAGEAVYRLNGVPPVALPPANNPIEDGIRINKRCAVLAVVSFKRATEDESALILGTPTKAGHCPTE